MKEKILNALKTKFQNLGLSEKAFDGVAEFYSKTITEESKIDEVTNNAEPMLKLMQGEADRVRNDSAAKKVELDKQIKELQDKLAEASKTNPPQRGGGEDDKTSETIKQLQETLKGLVDKNVQAEKALIETNLKESAKKIMLAKGIKETLCDKILGQTVLSETDTAESISTKGIEEYNFIKSEFVPEAGTPQSGVGAVSENGLDDYFKRKAAQNEQRQKLLEDVKQI